MSENVAACTAADVFQRQKLKKTYCLSEVVVVTDVLVKGQHVGRIV